MDFKICGEKILNNFMKKREKDIAKNHDLRIHILPSQLLIKNFIEGYDKCNYEIYLLEFINSSLYFLEKSNYEKYVKPLSEEKGQCDCISKKYKLDFKLLLPETLGRGKREFSTSITQMCEGVTLYGESNKTSKSPDYKEISATMIHVAFRSLSYNYLCEIAENPIKKCGVEKDLYLILQESKKAKNILFMLPYELYYIEYVKYEIGLEEIIAVLNSDFEIFFKYRKDKQPSFDTFISFIYHEKFVISYSSENGLKRVDEIDLILSTTFQELNRFSNY